MKFSFAARLILIIALGFSCLALSLSAMRFIQRGWATHDLPKIPLPDQLVAMVNLLENASPEKRLLLLRAFNTSRTQVYIAKQGLKGKGKVRMVRTEGILHSFFDVADYRNIRIFVADEEQKLMGKAHLFVTSNFALSIRLKTNEYLIYKKYDNLNASIFGVPPGFWAGIIGLFVTILVMIAVLREIGPLRMLAEHVKNFSHLVKPVKVEVKGAAEVRLVISAFNELQERINELMQGRSLMISAIAHDFRTYLTRFRLRLEKVDAPVRDKLIADIEDMSSLIDKSLELARIEREDCELVAIDLAELVRDECSKVECDQKLKLDQSSVSSARIHADELSIRRIMSNIIDNALKYGEHAHVKVVVKKKKASVVIDDDGPGIPETERCCVFEPYRRLEISRNRATGGIGLGLAIASKLTEQNLGEIEIASSPSGGARFIVTFPLYSSARKA